MKKYHIADLKWSPQSVTIQHVTLDDSLSRMDKALGFNPPAIGGNLLFLQYVS